MRNFRYIEPGNGRDSLSNHEINELDVDFDIKVDGFYALMPVTKYEFGLLASSSNRDWTRGDERLPVDEPGVEKPSPYKFKIGDMVVLYPKNKHVPGWKDRGVGEVVEQSRLYRNEAFNPVYDKKENCYGIMWEGLSGPIYSFEDNLMPAPETSRKDFIRDEIKKTFEASEYEFVKNHCVKIPAESKILGETLNISSVVAERFMQMDRNIQEFIRQEVEKEVKAELDRRGFEDSEY